MSQTNRRRSSCVYHLYTDDLLWQNFYRAMLCIGGTSHGPVSVCLCLCLFVSVCLSQAGVLLKRQNVGSHIEHHTIPQGL